VATARATEPRVLLLDEPLAGLRPAEANELLEKLGRLRNDGVSVVLVEHNVSAVTVVADRMTVLDAGRVIATGSPAEVLRDPEVRRAYLGG
jgi:branched-chain amino acid transport system ATP-binding protein